MRRCWTPTAPRSRRRSASAPSSSCPSAQRNVWNLASTTPGVLTGLNSDIGLSFRGAGQREIQNSLSLDGINASANLLATTSMRPIADAVTEVQVQTGSTSAEYGAYLGVHINVVTKSGTNDLSRQRLRLRGGRLARRARLLREPGEPEEPAEPQAVRGRAGRPAHDPRPLRRPRQDVLHDRVRRRPRRGDHEPVRLRPDGPHAAGELLRDQHADQEPGHGAAVPGQHHPAVDAVADVDRPSPVLPEREPGRHRQQPPGRRSRTRRRSTSSWAASITTSATRSG